MTKEQTMFKKLCFMISLAILLFSCEDKSVDPAPVNNRDILEKLSSLEGVEVTEIVPQNGCPSRKLYPTLKISLSLIPG